MKQFLLFILPVIAIVMFAVLAFAVVQRRIHDDRINDEQRRRVKALAESIEVVAESILENNNELMARRLTASFDRRKILQGVIIYLPDGRIAKSSERISSIELDHSYANQVAITGSPLEQTESVNGIKLFRYILPLFNENSKLIGMVEVIHEITKPQGEQLAFWKRLSIFLIILSSALALLTTLLQRRIFLQPVNRITQWFHSFLQGQTDEMQPKVSDSQLKKFASEVEQIALGLKVAKRSLAQNASSKLEKQDTWTEEKLKNLIRARIGESSLCVVSNREPVMHKYDKSAMTVNTITPAGGVVTAIHPILEACGGTWVAHGSGDQDKKFVNSKNKLGVPLDDNRYILKRVWLTKEEELGYYYGFSNEGLWPLCHNTHTRPVFREDDWKMYQQTNRKFAESVIEELPVNSPFVFVQDYHFTLIAKFIKEKRPDATIALFWHIPWPTAEAFAICPYGKKILEGLLCCDLIGFHLQSHCLNFLETVNKTLECRIDIETNSILRNGRQTLVRPFPISVETSEMEETGDSYLSTLAQAERLKREFILDGKIVALGVDRIDYTKGIIERFLAIERLLEKHQEYIGKFVFIQIGSPSRTHIKAYHDFSGEVDALVERINWKFSREGWTPIIYLKKHFDGPQIVPFYTLADLCIVSSLHDGMNLVAKEYVAAKKDNTGVLILSQFAGASREFTDAVQINPYSTEEFANAIHAAIDMPLHEKETRMRSLRAQLKENNVYKWAGNIVTEMVSVSTKKNIAQANEFRT